MKSNLEKYVRANLRRVSVPVSESSRRFSAWWVYIYRKALEADRGVGGNDDRREVETLRLLRRLVELLNGDWLISGLLLHHCQGCCASDEACIEKVLGVLTALWIDRSMPVPSFKSWTNCVTVLVDIGVLLFCHDLLFHCGPHLGEPILAARMRDSQDGDKWHADEKKRKKKWWLFWSNAVRN